MALNELQLRSGTEAINAMHDLSHEESIVDAKGVSWAIVKSREEDTEMYINGEDG